MMATKSTKRTKISFALRTSLLLLLLLAGCATPRTQRAPVDQALVEAEARKQREVALEEDLKLQRRLMRVAFPILAAATPLCGDDVRPALGMLYLNQYNFPSDMLEVVREYLDIGEGLEVVEVIDRTPAAAAGVQVGDVILSIDGHAAPEGKTATREFAELVTRETRAGAPSTLVVSRDGQELGIEITPVEVCDYAVLVVEGDVINAFADGEKIVVTRGMMRFAQSDEELALVISHELAHNAMSHVTAQRINYTLGSIVDILAAAYGVNTQGAFGTMAAQAHSQEFEAEADYVGLYAMARAGYDVSDVARFWRRMAIEHPGSIRQDFMSTHPASPERFVAIEATVKEIEEKKRAGLPLEPNLTRESLLPISIEPDQPEAEEEEF